jgi:hypothetical protein
MYAETAVKVPYKPQQIKKPWFLKQWVINWVREDWEKARSENQSVNSISRIDHDAIDSERAIRFNIYHANGGRVVEISSYDRHKDRTKRSLYVITSDQDFGREIDKIITMEALK